MDSVEGFSLNYLVFNIFGYSFYSIYNTLGYFLHMKGAGTVVVADLVFSYHALFVCGVLAMQTAVYPKGRNSISWVTVLIVIGLWGLVAVEVILTVVDMGLYSSLGRLLRVSIGIR
jgi:hypothetical protein